MTEPISCGTTMRRWPACPGVASPRTRGITSLRKTRSPPVLVTDRWTVTAMSSHPQVGRTVNAGGFVPCACGHAQLRGGGIVCAGDLETCAQLSQRPVVDREGEQASGLSIT